MRRLRQFVTVLSCIQELDCLVFYRNRGYGSFTCRSVITQEVAKVRLARSRGRYGCLNHEAQTSSVRKVLAEPHHEGRKSFSFPVLPGYAVVLRRCVWPDV